MLPSLQVEKLILFEMEKINEVTGKIHAFPVG